MRKVFQSERYLRKVILERSFERKNQGHVTDTMMKSVEKFVITNRYY